MTDELPHLADALTTLRMRCPPMADALTPQNCGKKSRFTGGNIDENVKYRKKSEKFELFCAKIPQ